MWLKRKTMPVRSKFHKCYHRDKVYINQSICIPYFKINTMKYTASFMNNIQSYIKTVKTPDLMLKDILLLSPQMSINVQRDYHIHDLTDM